MTGNELFDSGVSQEGRNSQEWRHSQEGRHSREGRHSLVFENLNTAGSEKLEEEDENRDVGFFLGVFTLTWKALFVKKKL